MALASVVGTAVTAGTGGTADLSKAWRKIQGNMKQGYQAETEEWGWLKSAKIPRNKINISAREITHPINIKRATHAALINEGSYEALPLTSALNEVTLTWSNYNIRWPTTLTAKYLDRLGQDNQITKQFRYQAMKAVEGLSDTVLMARVRKCLENQPCRPSMQSFSRWTTSLVAHEPT